MAISLFCLLFVQMELAIAFSLLNAAPLLLTLSRSLSPLLAVLVRIPVLPFGHVLEQFTSGTQADLAEINKILIQVAMMLISAARSNLAWPLTADRDATSEIRLMNLVLFANGNDIELCSAYLELFKAQIVLLLVEIQHVLFMCFGISFSLVFADAFTGQIQATCLPPVRLISSVSGPQAIDTVPEDSVPTNRAGTNSYGRMLNASKKRRETIIWLLKRKFRVNEVAGF